MLIRKIAFLLLIMMPGLIKAQITIIDDDGSERKFEKVESEASFIGGAEAWKSFLIKNLNANIPVKNDAPIGSYQVIVRFIVDKNGKVSNAEAETNFGYGMEAEVLRIIKKAGEWVPAKQNGKSVNAYRRQPVTFVVEDENIQILPKSIFKTGTENIINVSIRKTDAENIELAITNGNGSVKSSGNGKFFIKPSQPGKVVVDIYVNKKGKRKKISSAFFQAN